MLGAVVACNEVDAVAGWALHHLGTTLPSPGAFLGITVCHTRILGLGASCRQNGN